jgi:hypothetical protein
MKSGIVFGVLLIFSILLLSLFSVPVTAQGYPTATAVAPTANPTISPSDLEKINANLEDIDNRVDNLEGKTLPFIIWMAVLAAIGLGSPLVLAKVVYSYHKKALDEAIRKADPRNFPVYVPKRNFEVERQNLQKLGLKKLRTYEFLGEIEERGVVVIHIPGENFDKDINAKKRLVETVEELQAFMTENKDKPLAYVIYVKGQPQELRGLLESGNIAAANMPITIAGHIYTLARSLMD